MKKIEDFYKKAGGKEYDKEGKKEKNFTYHDLIGFTSAYQSKQLDLGGIRLSFISIEKAVNDLNLSKKVKWYVENGELCRKGKLCPEPVIVNGRPVLINEA